MIKLARLYSSTIHQTTLVVPPGQPPPYRRLGTTPPTHPPTARTRHQGPAQPQPNTQTHTQVVRGCHVRDSAPHKLVVAQYSRRHEVNRGSLRRCVGDGGDFRLRLRHCVLCLLARGEEVWVRGEGGGVGGEVVIWEGGRRWVETGIGGMSF
jgi:hypothetical protein